MPISTISPLVSKPVHVTTRNDKLPSSPHERVSLNDTRPTTRAISAVIPMKPFPIARLPYELRQLIYTHYFARFPTQDISCSNAHLPHHKLTSLASSSPFLAFDPAHSLFYRHATFAFSCPDALRSFSKALTTDSKIVDRRKDIRKVQILYGRHDQPARDWVYLLASNFPSLEVVTFSVISEKDDLSQGHRRFGKWWGCVRDAVREGLGVSRKILLRAEDGEWSVVEVVRI